MKTVDADHVDGNAWLQILLIVKFSYPGSILKTGVGVKQERYRLKRPKVPFWDSPISIPKNQPISDHVIFYQWQAPDQGIAGRIAYR